MNSQPIDTTIPDTRFDDGMNRFVDTDKLLKAKTLRYIDKNYPGGTKKARIEAFMSDNFGHFGEYKVVQDCVGRWRVKFNVSEKDIP